VVPTIVARQRIAFGALGAAEVLVVVAISAKQGTGGVAALVGAFVLAPVAVAVTALIANRIAGERFAVCAGTVFVILPLLASRYMLSTYRGTFDARVLPALVGLRHTAVFALGMAVAVVFAFAPRLFVAVGGAFAFIVAAAAWQLDGVSALRPALHETVWSITLLEWLVVSGILGAFLRSPPLATGVGGWLLAGVLWAAHRGYGGAVFWQSLAGATPAVAVLLSSLALLVPRRRRPARPPAAAPSGH
jgi:hypothetical protein